MVAGGNRVPIPSNLLAGLINFEGLDSFRVGAHTHAATTGEIMMATTLENDGDRALTVPWWFWLLGVLLLIWNGYAALDYVMSTSLNPNYFAAFEEPLRSEMMAFIQDMPGWVRVTWAVAAFGAVAGAILWLLRSRFSHWAFVVSLIAMVPNFIWQLFIADAPTMPGWVHIFTVAIIGIAVWEVWYTKRLTARGWLR